MAYMYADIKQADETAGNPNVGCDWMVLTFDDLAVFGRFVML